MPDKLYSAEEVLAMFPEGQRTSLRRLKKTAREAGCCCVIGRSMSFTAEQITELQDFITVKEAGGWKDARVVERHYGHLEKTPIYDTMRELSRKKP